jgi:hypothetical protein
MMTFTLICILIIMSGTAFLAGLLAGYHIGVKETEGRWSDAVAGAEHSRKWEPL